MTVLTLAIIDATLPKPPLHPTQTENEDLLHSIENGTSIPLVIKEKILNKKEELNVKEKGKGK